jgi:hypothetical protein
MDLIAFVIALIFAIAIVFGFAFATGSLLVAVVIALTISAYCLVIGYLLRPRGDVVSESYGSDCSDIAPPLLRSDRAGRAPPPPIPHARPAHLHEVRG